MSAAEPIETPRGLSRESSFTRVVFAYVVALAVAVGVAWVSAGRPDLHAPGLMQDFSTLAAGDLCATLVIFGFSLAWRNTSVYDPFWSIIPPLFPLGYWALGGAVDPRGILFCAVIWIWAGRLTFNWIRGWQGLDHEDFRYRDLQRKFGKGPLYWLVSLTGLHLFPTVLVLLGLLPTVAIFAGGPSNLGVLDIAGAGVVLAGVLLELVADEQLREFTKGRTSRDAICDVGLWRYSRHPNYFGEVLIWVGPILMAMSCPQFEWWMASGAVAMLGLFSFASIPMMEARQLARKPAYVAYQRRTSMLIPMPPRR
jgi:steroid 5-alpha reductase family enzyme